MTLPPDLPIVDHHCHLSPSGEGLEAARRFARLGGTHLFLATQQYGGATPRTLEAYRDQFETTEALARKIHEEIGIIVYPVVAPYPVDLLPLVETLGLSEAVRLHEQALDLAGRLVEEQRVVALGEVGRPHFPTSTEIAEAADELFRYALGVARDAGCAAVVHSEDLDAGGFRELAALAAQTSFPVSRLVKHYVRSKIATSDSSGIAVSVLARRELVVHALSDPGTWFLETDFLDDPQRPGAVLDLTTVPRRAREIIDRSISDSDRLRMPFVEAIARVYGFTPTVPERRTP